MTLTLELTPEQETRLTEVAHEAGLKPDAFVQKLIRERLPQFASTTEQDPTLALFEQWRQEDAQMTPEEIEQERLLWEQFEKGINETRQASGMRLL